MSRLHSAMIYSATRAKRLSSAGYSALRKYTRGFVNYTLIDRIFRKLAILMRGFSGKIKYHYVIRYDATISIGQVHAILGN